MNNPQSDGTESVIDIFVLGESETGTQELRDQLEHQNYQVTTFSDGPALIETLRLGKPNLIICDTTSYGQEAYDYCRQIKADDNLWMIPVMILTRASSLGDLLYVLDSNADNFIAQPYDSPYLLSLIEGMLSTPVERQTTDQIKTQFKIQHDERIFVVTADRRKLLEFLLSAFEIAVKNSEDLSAAYAQQQALSVRVTTLEDAGREQERAIGMLSASVKKKELDERTLKGDLEETEQALDEKTAEVGKLSRDLGDARTLLATAEEQFRILLDEKEKTAVAHQSETSLLNDQISSLSQEILTKTTGLETAQQALETETTRSAMLELAVREITGQKEHLDTMIQALTREKEELVLALSQEKERAQTAEGEMQSVFSAKVKSEQELTRLVDELKEAALRQNDEILALRSDLDSETSRYTSAEKRLESLRQELEQLRATHEVAGELQLRQSEELQARYDTTVATLFAQERELKCLKDEHVVALANAEKSATSAASITAAFNDLQAQYDKSVATLFAQERDVKVLRDELAVAQDENKKSAALLASVKAASNETRVEIEEREWKIQSLEKQITDIGIQKATSDEKARALTASLESVQAALNAQKAEHAALGAKLEAAIRERDISLQSVHSSHEQTKNDLALQKNNFTQLNRDLEAAALLRSTLQGDIAAASSRIKELEHELKSAVLSKDQNGQQVRSLAEELGVVKTTLKETSSALAAEKEQHLALQAQLKAAIRERDETLQSVRGAHDQTKTDLDGHRNDLMRLNRDLATANELNATLLADFNAASARIAGLEGELNSVVKGKEQTGQQARSLSEDLEGTRAELETERRIRRTAEMNLQKSAELTRRLEGEIARSTAEREGLKSALEQEKKLHTAAEEKIRAATQAKEHVEHEYRTVKNDYEQDDSLRAAKIQKLNKDFEEVLARQRILEQKVTTLESEKAAAEARADALSDEIQQARTALADEWEDHMNDEERLAATEKKAVLLEQTLSATGKAAPERKWAVVVKQTGLPAEIRPTPQAIVVTPPAATHAAPVPPQTPEQKPEDAPSPGIEDLFEDDPVGPVTAEQKPDVPLPPVQGAVTEIRGMMADEDPAVDTNSADENNAREETDEDAEEDADEDADDDGESENEAADPAKTLDDFVAAPSSYGISFNRQQWLG
ncbi:MAG: response regulator, partial [Methanoregula sp.]|nr:response regulator [Methanoregula sp.]